MATRLQASAVVVAVLAAVLVMGPGCETTDSQDTALTVSASPSGELTGVGATATLTASTGSTNTVLQLPLIWTVSDSNLGVVKSSAGLTAVYESKGPVGNNVVTVRDQGEAEGIVVINQR